MPREKERRARQRKQCGILTREHNERERIKDPPLHKKKREAIKLKKRSKVRKKT